MKVLVGMSGGVDSSVAAAMMIEAGHDLAGATLRLWGGDSDSGCCSVADVDDARRVAQQLGIPHYVFNFSDEFDERVVDPYVQAHVDGQTPNPCIECNRHLKFDRFLQRARRLGFDAIATGHHVRRIGPRPDGSYALARGEDRLKDQSYVVHMIAPEVLSRCLFPIGEISKDEVRKRASQLQLRTADKPESMDVCFIAKTGGGRRVFLGDRIPLRPARVVDQAGEQVGSVDAVELVTIGQRKGLGGMGGADKRYVVDVDTHAGVVTVGEHSDLLTAIVGLHTVVWGSGPKRSGPFTAQCSAHGAPVACSFDALTDVVTFTEPHVRVAPGQTVVLYEAQIVVGGGIAS
jgi:tRNA-uridine 2-sulfurtransferase